MIQQAHCRGSIGETADGRWPSLRGRNANAAAIPTEAKPKIRRAVKTQKYWENFLDKFQIPQYNTCG
jgi:hypothetical protein